MSNVTKQLVDDLNAQLDSLGKSTVLTSKSIQAAVDSLAPAKPYFNSLSHLNYPANSVATTSHTNSNIEFFQHPRYRDSGGSLIYGCRMENTTPGHNKEYTVTVTAKPLAGASNNSGANEYCVEGAWGPIDGTLTKQVKDIDGQPATSNKTRAVEAAKDLERAKKAKGYIEQFKFEEDDAAMEEYASSLDWTVTDDLIVSSESKTDTILKEVDRNCFCYQTAEELSQFSYAEPTPAGLDVAPMIMGPGFGFVRFDDLKRGARWLVTVLSSCNPYPEPHARAVPVGEPMDDAKLGERRRSTPQYIEDLVIDSIDSTVRLGGNIDFVLLVEERGVDVVVIDALRWDAEDLTDTSWFERRNVVDGTFGTVFTNDRKMGRHITLAPRVVSRLRESYLAEGNKTRFELYQLEGRPGSETWLMPRL